MNRTTVLVVGFLSMALFAILCVRHNVAAIQDDIGLRAGQMLDEADAGWADVSVSGRDLNLGGIAPSRAARDRVTAALATLRGLRKLTDQSVLSSRAASESAPGGGRTKSTSDASPALAASARTSDGPYWFSVTRSGQRATLEGLMPDHRSRDALVTLARRRMANEDLSDRLEVRSGSPPGWRDVTTAALLLSGALEEGEVAVRGRSVFVRGLASNDTTVDAIRNELQSTLPDGYSGQAEVQPAAKLNELLRTAPGAASRLAERRAAARREAAASSPPASAGQPSAAPAPVPGDTTVAEVTAAVPSDKQTTGLSAANCQAEFDALLARERVVFETGSHVIDTRSRTLLDRLATVAGRCPAARIVVGGHTDDQGTESNNLALSQRRAEAVVQYLATRGVGVSRMTARGYGEGRPLVRNRTAEHRARNRRIELTIIEDD